MPLLPSGKGGGAPVIALHAIINNTSKATLCFRFVPAQGSSISIHFLVAKKLVLLEQHLRLLGKNLCGSPIFATYSQGRGRTCEEKDGAPIHQHFSDSENGGI
jgi:hypothetical protein